MRFTKTIASASVAAVLGLAGVSVAGATSNPGSESTVAKTTAASSPAAPKATQAKPGRKATRKAAALRRWIRRGAGVVAAKAIGITRPELRQELLAGKTIAAIATEHGVQPQAVIDALKAAADKRIEAAQNAGKITAERATKLKNRLDTAIPKIVNDWHPRKAKG
jgi:hypothetical protein